MALEKKFLITDPGLVWAMQTIEQLGKYRLSPRKILEIEDAYLDTKKRRLLAAGYSLRKRNRTKGAQITLVRLHSPQSPTKHWNASLKKNNLDPADWPDSQVRKRVLRVIPGKKLRAIMDLSQTRITRFFIKDNQKIAKINLDEVTLTLNGKERHFKYLKIKVRPPHGETQLKKITRLLQAEWPLGIEVPSKFEHALSMETRKNK